MASETAETIIGAGVIALAAGFLFYAANTADVSASGSYPLVAKFSKADGVTVGGDVRLSGVKIGSVTGLALDPQTYQARVTLAIRDGIAIPADSSIRIASDGLLGGAFVSVDAGGDETMLAAGEEIEHTQGSVSLLDLVGKAIHSVGN